MHSRANQRILLAALAVVFGAALVPVIQCIRSFGYMRELVAGTSDHALDRIVLGEPGRQVVFSNEDELQFWTSAIAGADFRMDCIGRFVPLRIAFKNGITVYGELCYDPGDQSGELRACLTLLNAMSLNDPEYFHIAFADAPESMRNEIRRYFIGQ